MDFKVLAVGDVVGNPGMERIRRSLRKLKRDTGADFVIVNGENASVVGMTPMQGEDILDAGADVITMGNHTFGKRELVDYLDDCPQIISTSVEKVPSIVSAVDASGLTDGSGSHHWGILRPIRQMKGVSLDAQSSTYAALEMANLPTIITKGLP